MTTSVELLTNNTLDVFDAFRAIFRHHNRAVGGNENIILNPNPNVRIPFWALDIRTPCTEIQTWFNREAHAWFQYTRLAARLVDANVVDIKANPVACVVHVPALEFTCFHV